MADPMAAFTPAPIVPIQIRAGVTVFIQGLPHDLTKKEAEKIAGVVMAFASPATPNPVRSDGPA